MHLSSPAFTHNTEMPSLYTCDEKDINPPLAIQDVPMNATSLALIVDDPDAPNGNWVHWIAWNIPPSIATIEENSLPIGAEEGTTDFGKTGYGGPCPPSGTHRYFFKLYALTTRLTLPPSTKKADLEKAMEGNIIAQAQLIGLYQRKK